MIGWDAQHEVDLDRPTWGRWPQVILKFIPCVLTIAFQGYAVDARAY